jgi:H+/Cl- antiporter ClcA
VSSLSPVLLASVLSALVAENILGQHLTLILKHYSLQSPLLELPLYLGLGAVCGSVAFIFSRFANWSKEFFAGEIGNETIKHTMRSIPAPAKPCLGGLICGLVGLAFPQILFFGYETLNGLLSNSTLPTTLLLSLLLVKIFTTGVSAGSGLVGGTFAPSLFLGAMTGGAFHNIVSFLLIHFNGAAGLAWEIADIPAYAMVGAASVLAALFRAPLTASLLLFEM